MNSIDTPRAGGQFPDPLSQAPEVQDSQAAAQDHSVQFYADDAVLLDDLTHFLGGALGAGDAVLVVATKAHRDALASRLQGHGLDIAQATKQGRYVSLDAAETLAEFMVDDWPDPARFSQFFGHVIDKATTAVSGERPRIAAFGEMVAVLWAERKTDQAIRLEQLWNEFGQSRSINLRCAYPIASFSHVEDEASVRNICAEHSRVVSAQSYSSSNDEARLSSIIFLQQKSQALEREILERKRVQQVLQEREAELREFLENATIGMHWVDTEGMILWANRAEMELLGYGPEEYIGHNISEFHADRQVLEDILQRLHRKEELLACEARLRAKDGSLRHVRINSNIFRKDGRFIHTRCFTIDLTEQRRAEEGIQRLAAIVESSEDAIISKDMNGIVTSWNAAAERIFGFQAAEMIGRSITRIIPPELLHDEEMILGKIRRGERIEHFQTVRQKKNGERIDVSLTISPVKDSRGTIVGAAKIARDITQQKKLENALHTTERLASVGRLAATVAHEINNPLESVTNFVYLAKTSPELSSNIRRYLECADQELSRVSHIARQTLGFYRDNSRPVSVAVAEAANDVLAIYQRKLEYKGVTVRKEVESGLTVCALEGEFKQVLSNLISNAINASREGGTIWVRACHTAVASSGEPGINIVVADNGLGISREHQEKIFNPFFTTNKEVGTGLGLWITKELVERAGGQIRVRSRVGSRSGTVVSIFLPFKTSDYAGQVA